MTGIQIRYQQQLGTQFFDIDLKLPAKGISAILGAPEREKHH